MKAAFSTFARLALATGLALCGSGFYFAPTAQGQDLSLQPTTPRLTSAECQISLDIAATMKRANDALLAAGLTLHKPLPQTIGANNEWVFALINCARSEGQTRVISTVAANPTKSGESYRVCMFLNEYMRTGQAPTAAALNLRAAGVWDWKWVGYAGAGTSQVTLHPTGKASDQAGTQGEWWAEGEKLFVYWGGPFPKTNLHYVQKFTLSDDGTTMSSTAGDYYTRSVEGVRVGDAPVNTTPVGIAPTNTAPTGNVGTATAAVSNAVPVSNYAAPVSFTGLWTTEFGYVLCNMNLTQDQDSVSGTYDYQDGKLAGKVIGKVLRFNWFQPLNRKLGTGSLILADDGNSFTGHWSETDDPDNKSGGIWQGTRLQAQAGADSVPASAGTPGTVVEPGTTGGAADGLRLPNSDLGEVLLRLNTPQFAPPPLPLPSVGAIIATNTQNRASAGASPRRLAAADFKPINWSRSAEANTNVRIRTVTASHVPEPEGPERYSGKLQVDVVLSEPAPRHYVDIYVGGYLDNLALENGGIVAREMGYVPAYAFQRIYDFKHNAHPDKGVNRRSYPFNVPGVLPARIRVELYEQRPTGQEDRLVQQQETTFDLPWQDYRLLNGTVIRDKLTKRRIIGVGVAAVPGVTHVYLGMPGWSHSINIAFPPGEVEFYHIEKEEGLDFFPLPTITGEAQTERGWVKIESGFRDRDYRNNHYWPNQPNKGYANVEPVWIGRFVVGREYTPREWLAAGS